MSLDVSKAVREGVTRTATVRGMALIALFFVIGIVGNVGVDSATQLMLQLAEELGEEPIAPVPPETMPFALPLPGTVVLFMLLFWIVAWAVAGVVTMRVLVAEPTEPLRSDRLAVASVNELIARILVWVLIGIGLILLIIPGIILAIGFYFVRPLIAVDDRNFVDAMIESWELSKGKRFDIFILLLVTAVIYLVILIPGTLAVAAAPAAPMGASLVSIVFSSMATVFWLAVIARAYDQVLEPDEPDDVVEETDDRPADFDEWDDPPGVDW